MVGWPAWRSASAARRRLSAIGVLAFWPNARDLVPEMRMVLADRAGSWCREDLDIAAIRLAPMAVGHEAELDLDSAAAQSSISRVTSRRAHLVLALEAPWAADLAPHAAGAVVMIMTLPSRLVGGGWT